MDNLKAQEEFYASIENNHLAKMAALALEAKHLQDMKATPGWAVVEAFLNEMIKGHTKQLIKSREAEEIQRLQERIQAYSAVSSFIEVKIREGIQPDSVGQLETNDVPENYPAWRD
jgi:hypothetical protein